MSVVANYATKLHESSVKSKSQPTPTTYRAKGELVKDIQVIIFDVYGTLMDYWVDGFSDEDIKQSILKEAFKKCADNFGFTPILEKIDPTKPAEQTLNDFYHGLIVMRHEQSLEDGKKFPEVEINSIWNIILSILIRNGYDIDDNRIGNREEFAKVIAYYYNFHSLKRGFFDGVVPALKELKKANFKLGILSNSQFYTPIDLSLFIRDQDDEIVDFLELFDTDLTFFSYEYGVAKPNPILYDKLYDALYEISVLPEQTLFVGNDLGADVEAASELGMKTALFTGNSESTFFHNLAGKVIPDIEFSSFKELPKKVSFYGGNSSSEHLQLL